MRVLLAAVCAVVLAAPAWAAPESGGGFGWFGPYVGFADFTGLNDAFAGAGITTKLEPMHWMMGGGGHGLIGRILIGGSGWGGEQTVASESLRARVELGGAEFDVGYAVLEMEHVILAPVLGIGGGGYTIELERINQPMGSFEELLRNPGRTSAVSMSSFLLAPQLVVTVPVKFVGLQLRGGYIYSPMSPEWELKGGGNLNLGPKIAKGMPFASLNVAFGGFGSSRRRSRD